MLELYWSSASKFLNLFRLKLCLKVVEQSLCKSLVCWFLGLANVKAPLVYCWRFVGKSYTYSSVFSGSIKNKFLGIRVSKVVRPNLKFIVISLSLISFISVVYVISATYLSSFPSYFFIFCFHISVWLQNNYFKYLKFHKLVSIFN